MREHLSSRDELEHHVQVGVVLREKERSILIADLADGGHVVADLEVEGHVDEEGEGHGRQDHLLVQRVLHLTELHNLRTFTFTVIKYD